MPSISPVEIVLGIVLGSLALAALAWFYAAYGAWMDDAYENGRWIWLALLIAFTFPISLIAWAVIHTFKERTAGRLQT